MRIVKENMIHGGPGNSLVICRLQYLTYSILLLSLICLKSLMITEPINKFGVPYPPYPISVKWHKIEYSYILLRLVEDHLPSKTVKLNSTI